MSNLSFREKSAWISFVLVLALAVVYFGKMLRHLLVPGSSHPSELLFPAPVLAVIAMEIAMLIVLTVHAPGDARTPRDERERLIALKARSVAYPVLAFCAFAAIGTVHLGANRFDMMQAVLFAIIAGELSRLGAEIVYFRRGL